MSVVIERYVRGYMQSLQESTEREIEAMDRYINAYINGIEFMLGRPTAQSGGDPGRRRDYVPSFAVPLARKP